MTGIMFKRGAHFVITHSTWTSTGSDADWMARFMIAINDGKSIYDAMEEADDYLYSVEDAVYGNLNQRHTLGDSSIVLKH